MVKYTDAAKAGIVGEGGYASRVESLKTAGAAMGWELGDYWVCNSQEVDAAFFIHGVDQDDAFQAALNTLNEAQGHIAEWRIIPVASVDAVDAEIANLTGKAVEPPK
tara:strand:+ start:48 stop:368 length:321 start_codon:yes stop_codon:yes gene_type:complete